MIHDHKYTSKIIHYSAGLLPTSHDFVQLDLNFTTSSFVLHRFYVSEEFILPYIRNEGEITIEKLEKEIGNYNARLFLHINNTYIHEILGKKFIKHDGGVFFSSYCEDLTYIENILESEIYMEIMIDYFTSLSNKELDRSINPIPSFYSFLVELNTDQLVEIKTTFYPFNIKNALYKKIRLRKPIPYSSYYEPFPL